jgi:hypothetical protein
MKYNQPYGITDPDASYINGNPATGQQGSIPPALSIEGPQREIHNFIAKSGFTPRDDDVMQLIKSIRRAFVNFGIDSGGVNSLVVTLDPPLESYYPGMPLRVLVAHNNTGAATINVNNLGPRPILTTTGSALGPNDISAGMIAYLVDDGNNYELMTKGGSVTGSTTNVDIPYTTDVGPVNQIHAVYAPALTSIAEGKIVAVKMVLRNTANVTFQPNALPPLPLLMDDGVRDLKPGDLRLQETILIENHSTYYQMLKPVPSQYQTAAFGQDLILYIRTDGNDANFGDANDAAHAFKTIGAAMKYSRTSLNIGGRQCTYQLGIAGTYNIDSSDVYLGGGTGISILRGDPANQDSYILSGSGGFSAGAGQSRLTGVRVVNSNAYSNTLTAQAGSSFYVNNVSVACTGGIGNNALLASFGTMYLEGSIRIQSNAHHIISAQNGNIGAGAPGTVISTTGTTFDINMTCYMNATIFFDPANVSFAGGPWYGMRYDAQQNGVINVLGAGPNYVPGSTPGQVGTGGIYG